MTRRPPARRTRGRPTGASGRFFAALTALVAVMIGVPALLVVCSQVGLESLHPLPGIGTGEEVKAFLERDLTATEIAPIAMRGLLTVGWLLWLGMAVSVVAAILDATGSGLRSAVPQFAMFAGLGRWIAAGLTAFSSLAPNFVSAGSLASPRPFTVSSAATASSVTTAEVPVPPGHARVQRGESIETFARRTLGDPARWPEIWELNKNKTVGPDGDVWTMAWKVSAGWDLRLPDGGKLGPRSDVAPPSGSPSVAGPVTPVPAGADVGAPSAAPHRVVAGESYWSIARGRLGDGATGTQVWEYTQALMAANASRLGYADPEMLQPGDDVELVAVEVADFAPGVADASSVPHVLVESGDSYWAIAEEELGDDAAPSDVQALTNDLIALNHPLLGYDAPPLIHPGDVVFLEDPSSFPPPAPVGDAADAVELDPALSEFVEVVQSVAADNEQLPPPVPAPPTTIAPPATVVPTTTTSTSTVPPATPDDRAAEAEPGAPARPPVGVGEAALLSTGIVALLAAKRRARLRAAEPPARLPLPRPDSAATERMLRQLDDGERLLRVDIALRAAAAVVAGTDHRVVVVRSAPDGTVEVSLSGPVTLGAPWTGTDRVWTLARTVPVEDLATPARSVGAPCIALVQIGVDELGWDVLVDLEAIGALAIEADDATADSVVRAVAVGLACSEFAEVAHLVGVGIDPSVFLGHRHAQVVGTLDDGIELAATLVGAPASNQRSTFSLRARQAGGEMWEPAVVLVASADAVALASSVPAPLSGRGGVSLVAAGSVPGAMWRLRPEGTSWLLDPIGIRLTPVGVDAAEMEAIAEAVAGDALVAQPAAVGDPPVVPDRPVGNGTTPGRAESHVAVTDVPTNGFDAATIPSILLPPDSSTEHVGARPATNGHCGDVGGTPTSPPMGSDAPPGDTVTFVEPDWTMMVRLIGPVDVVDRDGSPAKFDRSKTLELLAWLVTHRDRSTRVGARTALWEQDVRDATFANVVSEARRAMARHVAPPEGDEWLRRTLTDELSLHDLVISDADIAEARFAAGRTQTGEQALVTLRPALELLRDMPFSGASYLWPEVEGLASSLVLLSTNLTAEYARRALALGDFEGVFWATGTGLKVLPGQESLIALRMRAHAEAGDLSGVRLEWEVYERVINADPWSDGEPAPKLVSLRKELLSK